MVLCRKFETKLMIFAANTVVEQSSTTNEIAPTVNGSSTATNGIAQLILTNVLTIEQRIKGLNEIVRVFKI